MQTPTSLIYIHGFNSSPASHKAGLLRDIFAAHGAEDRLLVPALPVDPKVAMQVLESTIAGAGPVALLGSSLGGFYATWLAAHHDLKTVLINPVVRPWLLLQEVVGQETENYHTGEKTVLQESWVNDLQRYDVAEIPKPENVLALIQSGDETLDWRDAWDYYQDCHIFRGVGGSHAFDDFDAFIPMILRFCGVEWG